MQVRLCTGFQGVAGQAARLAVMARLALYVVVVAFVMGIAVAPASATHYQDFLQVAVYAPPRVYDNTQTLPVEEFERTRPLSRFRVDGHTHRGYWNNVVFGGSTMGQALSQMRRAGQRPSGLFADRRLTAAERKRFRDVAPLYDDADVMVVAAGHPACRGITRAQARSIVAGTTTRWSQIVGGATTDAISVRYRGSGASADLRFGARYVRRASGRYTTSYPPGSRGSADGGLSAAASGDHSVAAVTAWSRFRTQPGVCAVPLGGVAPTNATVVDHTYPEAFRVTYVAPRRRIRSGVNRRVDQIVQAFMKSDAARAALARRGLLVVGGAPPTGSPGGSAAAPATDHAGRPISTTADATGEQALTGLRLESEATPEGRHRLVFDPDGALRRLTFDASGACVGESRGGWTVKGAWRYAGYGGGRIARLGWFLADPVDERVIDLPDAEPQTAYLDGTPYARALGASGTCQSA
jgi:ABC-type phosphate transport system substrate-binding protein